MPPVVAAICVAALHSSATYAGEPPMLQRPQPRIVSWAASAVGFAPRGWKVEKAVKGDLNRDGQPDLAVCIVTSDGTPEPMDTNPRVVLIAFGTKTGFKLQLVNPNVIPRLDDPYMDDPLNLDAFGIKQDILRLGLTYWRSMGGWTTFSSTLSFRWDGKRMRLIGFDRDTTRRNSGETEEISVNFVTGKAKVTTGSMEDDKDGAARWHRILSQPAQTLDTIGDGLAYVPKLKGAP